jgi:DMSO/TMAO reductase YedYZ molybdopterin-dependent catalytic subunit
MDEDDLSRRTVLKGGGAAALAALTVLRVAGPAGATAERPIGEDASFDDAGGGTLTATEESLQGSGEQVIPWLDQPAPLPPGVENEIGHQLVWEQLDSWLTPNDEFFTVKHYNEPSLAASDHRVTIGGLVSRPMSLSLADLKSRARRGVDFALECSGNHGLPFFNGGVGNARWVGTPLAPLLRRAGVHSGASEVVFWGADKGEVTIRDNAGVLSGGQTGTLDPSGALRITEHFARSMALDDAMNSNNLLCYEMNGLPLSSEHGAPVRLIAPGWYGVANVKWLSRIEVTGQRYAGRFMARDYVTIREEQRGEETIWTFATVGHDRLKSAPAKVIRRDGRYSVLAAAWGAPISKVEIRIDEGPWQQASLIVPSASRSRRFSWSFWTLKWTTPTAGEHTVTSRAHDADGHVQPDPSDPFLASKRTYWESNGQITRRVEIPD